LFSHPVYQYFERRYGFNGRSLHWEPDSVPPVSEWTGLETVLADHPAGLMIWEDEPLAENVERLRALGVESVVFAPAGNRPASGDFSSRMQANIQALERAAPR
jgi:zinc transport system substrate-binding protein